MKLAIVTRAPLSIAVASNDLESVEELLAYRANPDIASDGEEPPLCSAVRDRRRGIVSALLQHRADRNIRSLPPPPPLAEGRRGQGLTPLELAAGDERLVDLLTDYCCTHALLTDSRISVSLGRCCVIAPGGQNWSRCTCSSR